MQRGFGDHVDAKVRVLGMVLRRQFWGHKRLPGHLFEGLLEAGPLKGCTTLQPAAGG